MAGQHGEGRENGDDREVGGEMQESQHQGNARSQDHQ